MLDIQHLQGDVLHQHWKDMDVIVSRHQFSKTQTTQNSMEKQQKETNKNLLKCFFLNVS
jgi:3-dehydroquinate dehydratase